MNLISAFNDKLMYFLSLIILVMLRQSKSKQTNLQFLNKFTFFCRIAAD